MLSTLLLSITLFATVQAAGLNYSVRVVFFIGNTEQAQAKYWRDNTTYISPDSQRLSSWVHDMDRVDHLLFYASSDVRTFHLSAGTPIR